MWRKIKSITDVSTLKVGDILAKYPIEGSPEEEINTDNLYQFEIYSLGFYIELKVHDSEIEEISNVFGGLKVTGIGGNPPVLKKAPAELIDESIWWVQS